MLKKMMVVAKSNKSKFLIYTPTFNPHFQSVKLDFSVCEDANKPVSTNKPLPDT